MASANGSSRDATETERVYALLKSDILSARMPAGSVLRQTELATRFGTSRTPVREAVAKLASEYLVDLSPRQRAQVARLSIRDYLEVNQVRLLLEPAAARAAAANMTDAEIGRLESRLAAFTQKTVRAVRGIVELDQFVHSAIADSCNNDRMRRYIDQLNGMMAIARFGDIERRPDEMLASLQAIVAALRERDPDRAEREMQEHVMAFQAQLPLLIPRTASAKGKGI